MKKLKEKDEHQVELEKREQGFSLYINGANRESRNQPTSRTTKTADGMKCICNLGYIIFASMFFIEQIYLKGYKMLQC